MLLDLLRQQGYQAELSAKSRYLKGLVPLLGGQFALDSLQHAPLRRLFSNAQIRKGQAYSLSQLTQIAQARHETDDFLANLHALIARQVFSRGYRLQCPTCDLDTWYPLDQIAEQVICAGCRLPFQLPLTLDFAFRPNRLLIEALKSGALTTLLTFNYWLHQSPVTIWQSNVLVQRGDLMSDIDLFVQCEQGLYMAECKDHLVHTADAQQRLARQLEVGKTIADHIGATYVFATLHPDPLPSALMQHLEQHNITLLTTSQLLASSH